MRLLFSSRLLFTSLLTALCPAAFHCLGDPLATFGAQFAPGFLGGCRCNILTTLRTSPAYPAGLGTCKKSASLLKLCDLHVDFLHNSANFHAFLPHSFGRFMR